MTEREAIEAILAQWADGWEILHPDDANHPERVPWTTDGEVALNDSFGELGAWARISVQHTTADQVTHGGAPSRKFERRGNVFVQLFAPFDRGVGLLADLAEDVREVLEGKRLGELCLYAGRSDESPTDGRWAMRTVVLPFRYVATR